MASRSVQATVGATDEIVSNQWSAARRALVSLLIVGHLFCVVIAASVVPPTSELLVSTHRRIGPYLQLMYLNHGFRFFAPEPGPSHIVQYEYDSGSSGQFPDRDSIWPRLRYHRWFMLSETVYMDVSQYLTESQIAQWTEESRLMINDLRASGALSQAAALEQEFTIRRGQQLELNRMTEELCQSISRVLLRGQGGDGVKLFSVTREIPAPQDLQAGRRLTDALYLPSEGRIDLQTFRRGSAEPGPLESIR